MDIYRLLTLAFFIYPFFSEKNHFGFFCEILITILNLFLFYFFLQKKCHQSTSEDIQREVQVEVIQKVQHLLSEDIRTFNMKVSEKAVKLQIYLAII